jgi:undecaprenyl-diphosphatase
MADSSEIRVSAGKSRFEALDSLEMPLVRRRVATASRPYRRRAAIAINHLGNGWIYIPLAIIVIASEGLSGLRVAFTAAAAAVTAHCVYPRIKTHCARQRPIARDPTMMMQSVAPLDVYSFPSGHCMTAVAVFVPLYNVCPNMALAFAPMVLLIGWARLALGHHYPSDLACGAFLGAAAAAPACYLLL